MLLAIAIWKWARWLLLGAGAVLMLYALSADYWGTYWLQYAGPPRMAIHIFLPGLHGEPLAISPPGRIGVLGTTHPIEKVEKQISSHSVPAGPGPGHTATTTTFIYKTEHVRVESAQYEGEQEYIVEHKGKTYKVLLTWRKGKYTVYLDGRKVRRKFFAPL